MSPDLLIPQPHHFAHPSRPHGQAHVARVMVHALRLLDATGTMETEARRVWAAVYLHDLARTHDGVCHRYGAAAVLKLRTSEELQHRFAAARLTTGDPVDVELAVTVHCLPMKHEPARDHAAGPLVALLRDADGLDRVRLGDLNPSYLRWPQSAEMVEFAGRLFDATDGRIPEGEGHFGALLAAGVSGRAVPMPGWVGEAFKGRPIS